MGQNQQDKADEERRRANSQMNNKDDDKVTAKDFFKRLNSAMADPEGFKKRVAEKEASKQNQQQQQRQETTSPPQQNQQQGESITGKEFFQRLQSAMKDPQGFKRRVEAEKNQPKKEAPGQRQPGQNQQQGQGVNLADKTNPLKKPQGNNNNNAPDRANLQSARKTPATPKARPKPRPKSR